MTEPEKTPTEKYLDGVTKMQQRVAAQKNTIEKVADIFASTIAEGRLVHLFGAGHSRMMVEEMWPRYGSFPGFNPIVELSMTYHNNVVGPNGQRQAMFLENQSGLAEQILRNFDLSEKDSALIISSSGCNIVPIEVAELLQKAGVTVVALVSKLHSEVSTSNHPDAKKLTDFSQIVLDTGAPAGDAMVQIDGIESPIAPGSTVGGAMIVNALKAEIALRLQKLEKMPSVLTASCIVGRERSREMFQSAYDQHARRIAKLYENVGQPESDF